MALSQETIDWLMAAINSPETYPDGVEQIVDMKYIDNVMIVIAIDEGNPPIVPLKQIAFRFVYEDDTHEELVSYEFMLLNPDEVAGGASRPQQFAAFLPAQYWEHLENPDSWDIEACDNCAPDPDLI